MRSPIYLATLLIVGLAWTGPAQSQSAPKKACEEAMGETLAEDAPKEQRARILKACLAAFKEKSRKGACDRQAKKLPKGDRLMATYTCETAILIAGG